MRTWKLLKRFKKQSGTINAIIYHGYYSTRNASLFNNRRRRLLVEKKMKEYKVTVTITREYLIGAKDAETAMDHAHEEALFEFSTHDHIEVTDVESV